MSPPESASSSNDPDAKTDSTPRRDLTQWLGALVVLVGLALVVLASLGVVSFDDSTLRILLGFGTILLAGREAVRAAVERFVA